MRMDTTKASIRAWIQLLDVGSSEIDVELLTPESEEKEKLFRVSIDGENVGTIVWNPRTLKGVMDHALRLATVVHQMPVLMNAIAERETRLRSLRSWIKAPVKQQPPNAPTAVCLSWENEWRILGRWVPDLIDRGGGRPLLLDPGDGDRRIDPQDLILAEPDVMFIGSSADSKKPDFLTASDALLNRVRFSGRAYLIDMGALTGSGPELYDSVFVLAAGLYPEIEELESERVHLKRFFQLGTD